MHRKLPPTEGGHLGCGIWQKLPRFLPSPVTLCLRLHYSKDPPHPKKKPLSRCGGENLRSKLCIFARNISTNISAVGQGTRYKLEGLASLFIFINWYHNFLTLSTKWFLFHILLRENDRNFAVNRKCNYFIGTEIYQQKSQWIKFVLILNVANLEHGRLAKFHCEKLSFV